MWCRTVFRNQVSKELINRLSFSNVVQFVSSPRRLSSEVVLLLRLDIEMEIGCMIQNALHMLDWKDDEMFYVVDGYCHLDILFEK